MHIEYFEIYILIYSLADFNLSLIGAFTWFTPPGSYRTTTCREGELAVDHIILF